MIALILYLVGCVIAYVMMHNYLLKDDSFTKRQKQFITLGVALFSWLIVVVNVLTTIERDMDGRGR